jgi:hypothetical protein
MTVDGLFARARGWLVWLLPFALLGIVIAWEGDWGREWKHVPPKDVVVQPQPVVVAVLPEYQPSATPVTRQDMVNRTLFNPTRRPAPVLLAEAAKARIQRGQFALTGTIVVDGKAMAFLKEINGGRSRRVTQGDQINGMVLAEVKPDRIRFTIGDESEELMLKVVQNSKTTPPPALAAMAATAPGAPGAPATGTGAAPTAAQETATTLAQRRAAARAAEAAAPAPAPAATAAAPPSATAAPDPRWGQMDNAYRQRAQQQTAPRQQ